MDRLQRYVDQPVKWATIAGLILLIVSLFAPWAELDLGELGGLVPDISSNGFDHNGTLMLILAVVGLGAIGVYCYASVDLQLSLLLWGLLIIAVVLDLLVLVALLDIAGEELVSLGWGLWLAIVAAAVTTVGAVVPMWDEIRSRAGEMRSGSAP